MSTTAGHIISVEVGLSSKDGTWNVAPRVRVNAGPYDALTDATQVRELAAAIDAVAAFIDAVYAAVENA